MLNGLQVYLDQADHAGRPTKLLNTKKHYAGQEIW